MFGLLHALASVATLLLMCDGRDLGTAIGERPPTPDSEAAVEAGAAHAATLASEAANFMPARLPDTSPSSVREFFEPNLYLYDAYPGGIGFSEPLFRVHDLLVQKTRELIAACPCDSGCPSCVGPAGDLARSTKAAALAILHRLLTNFTAGAESN